MGPDIRASANHERVQVMKTVMYIIIGLSLVPLAYGKDAVQGSGKSVVVNRSLDGYDQIDFAVSGELYVTIGQQTPLAITADDNIAPLIKTKVENGKLEIRTDKQLAPKTGIVVRITVPNLKGLGVKGSADVHVTGLDNADFSLGAAGSCDVYLTGKTGKFSLGAAGSADIHAYELQAKVASVAVKGASDAEVSVSDVLNAAAAGSADITYRGSPQVHRAVSGSATVQKIGT